MFDMQLDQAAGPHSWAYATRGEWMKGWKKGAVFLQAGKDPVDMMQASLQAQGA